MLYDRWRSIVQRFGSATALVDASTRQTWTFNQLSREAEKIRIGNRIVFPQTNCPEFVLQVIRAWRDERVLCPLEPEQQTPALSFDLPKSIAHLKTTSATGGQPRLVAFAGTQLAADASNLVQTMGLRPDWPNLAVISLAHSYGFSNLVLPLLLHGVPLVLVGTALPEALKRAATDYPGVTLASVPALWKMWGQAHAIPSNVRLAISAGAPLPLPLEEEVWAHFGLKIHNFYGSSECGGIAYDATQQPRTNPACVGSAVAGVNVSLDARGCVTVRGAAVAHGYLPPDPERLGEGVFSTSDLGEFRNGLLYLKGRVGDLINVAGRKVAPEVIEQVLATHPAVRDVLAFGVPLEDGHRGERIVGCIAAAPGTTVEDLRRFAGSRLPAWQIPRDWWFVPSIATNQRGKLSRAEWRARYLKRTAP
jgi:acyl-CoA synthetase (AMP-forming)/AMP-acid ligase II